LFCYYVFVFIGITSWHEEGLRKGWSDVEGVSKDGGQDYLTDWKERCEEEEEEYKVTKVRKGMLSTAMPSPM